MATFTDFLNLTLPEYQEFVNSWNAPVNQNFETIDDYIQDIHAALVGTGSSAIWANLRGSLANLEARLAVSIELDGTLDISSSPSILDLATSAVEGPSTSPSDRFNEADFRAFDARQPFVGSRFVPIPFAGPSAAFPPEDLDPGVAIRSADFGVKTATPISSPHVPWSPGLVTGGGSPLILGNGIGRVRFNVGAEPAVFNIDGYVFRIREIVDFDYDDVLAPGVNVYVWIYVSRAEADYGSANFKYDGPGGAGYAIKDLRKLQQGTATGSTSGDLFVATGSFFNTAALGKVKEGDTLVVTTGAGIGSYVIDQLEPGFLDTKLRIRGTFKGASSGVDWHILDTSHPNIGAVITTTDQTVLPPAVPGRVYIARVRHQTGGNPDNIIPFNAGGVCDSGWSAVDAAVDFPFIVTHNLGATPTDVQVWFRTGPTATATYRPVVRRTVLTDFGTVNATVEPADISTALLLFPSAYVYNTDTGVLQTTTVALLNTTVLPAKGPSLFTDSAGAEQSVGQIRVIVRR